MLEKIFESIQTRPKYRVILPGLIRTITEQEIQKRSSEKEISKAVRSRLHQIGGAYFSQKTNYAEWLSYLSNAKTEGDQSFLQACMQVMRLHASTSERIQILPDFFTTCLQSITPVHSILDLACGLNPLAQTWMPLAKDHTYYACDIFTDMLDFLQSFFSIAGVNGKSFGCDLLSSIPNHTIQLAFLLKIIPLLDQFDKSIAKKLFQELKAEHILVSFPTRSLGGKEKGMKKTYSQRFNQIIEDLNYSIQSFQFPNEIAFLISK